jgi:lipopolysaccharide export system protein LptA
MSARRPLHRSVHHARFAGRAVGWAGLLGVLLLVLWPGLGEAQLAIQGKIKDFKIPDYYPPTSPHQTNRVVRTLLSGAEAVPLAGSQVRITGLRIASFREDASPELEITATECVFDLATRSAWGDGHLRVTSANGLYSIEGDGFQWGQSNAFLAISNRVVLTLQRRLLVVGPDALQGLTNRAVPPAGPATNQVIRITSDHCMIDSQSNRFTQTGHVVADDPQMQLGCETLQVQLTPARRLQQLVAQDNVSILNKEDQSRATAGRAVYALSGERELITLTDQPVWRDRDGRQEVRAARFTFDRTTRQIHGEGGALMRLPRGGFSQPASFLEPASTTRPLPAGPADTNQIQITAQTLTLLLPTTNRLHRSAIAETDVVILSPADDTRASGDKALYREDTGLIELIGHARWEAPDRLISADTLAMDRTNRVFLGRGNTLFRMPLRQAGQGLAFRLSTNRPTATNLVLEVQSDELTYRTNALVFQGGTVRARLLEASRLRGLLTCRTLTASFSQRLDRVVAAGRVMAESYPSPGASNRMVTNLVSCELLEAAFSEDGKTIVMTASENVQAAQIETRTPGPKTVVTDLTCGRLKVTLLPKAGKVDRIEAEQHVVISQQDKLARGGRALYTDKANQVVLSDHPYAEFAEGKLRDADTLIWDRLTGDFKGRGRYRLEWTRPFGRTNAFRLPILKK